MTQSRRGRLQAALFGICLLCLPTVLRAQGATNMPDPSLIAGKALPSGDLPQGTVTVRVVKRGVGNNMPGEKVTLTVVGGKPQTGTTDDQGVARFINVVPGSNGRAEATVNGEHLVSDPFVVPPTGGLRVILIAELAQAAAEKKAEEQRELAAPATKGVVTFGGNSRILTQFQNDELSVFYLFDLVNNARTRVDIGGPVIIDLPSGAGGASVLDGSSPSVKVNGSRITVMGPFAPGTTSVQVGYTLRYDNPDITLEQKFPIAAQQFTVGVQKVGNMAIASDQFAATNELRAEDGTVFLVGNAKPLQAGATFSFTMSNLPIHSRVPRYTALGLAVLCIAAGAWLAVGGRTTREQARDTLLRRRDSLLNQLEQLELKRRAGTINADRYAASRQRLVGELEQIYSELDEAGAGPPGGGEGIAA